ncbi:acireductone synthase [bacterium]|nr:acireductone synthase [bacterium]
MPREAILCDIEGTTTSLSFVHNILFPLSYECLEGFVRRFWNSDQIQQEIALIRHQISKEDAGPDEVIAVLRSWIHEDRKETALKSVQGKIWKDAFESGQIRGHVYPDVPPNFHKWNDSGTKICIFSSGSTKAQKLIFQYSEAGDLSKFVSAYFDTNTGPKKETFSYQRIASQLTLPAENILFLSDVEAELDAARAAKMLTTQVLREGVTPNLSGHPTVSSFDEI